MNVSKEPIVPTHSHAHRVSIQVSTAQNLKDSVDVFLSILDNRVVAKRLFYQILQFGHFLLVDFLDLQVFTHLLAVKPPHNIRICRSEPQEVPLLSLVSFKQEISSARPAQVLIELVCELNRHLTLLFGGLFCC